MDRAGMRGDLTPQFAASPPAVLDALALGKRFGPEDTRSHAQRKHDATRGSPSFI